MTPSCGGRCRRPDAGGPAAPLFDAHFRYEPVLDDIESLNQRSNAGELEITAISCAQLPHVADSYAVTTCGSSVGDQYGPILVAREPMSLDALRGADVVIAVPGERTSAFAATSVLLGAQSFRYEVVPFDEIIPGIVDGTWPVGLVIHEGQVTFADAGLHRIADVGTLWSSRCGLPLPLGLNTVRRDLGRPARPRCDAARRRRSVSVDHHGDRPHRRGARLREAVRTRDVSRAGADLRGHVRQPLVGRSRPDRAGGRGDVPRGDRQDRPHAACDRRVRRTDGRLTVALAPIDLHPVRWGIGRWIPGGSGGWRGVLEVLEGCRGPGRGGHWVTRLSGHT